MLSLSFASSCVRAVSSDTQPIAAETACKHARKAMLPQEFSFYASYFLFLISYLREVVPLCIRDSLFLQALSASHLTVAG